MTNPTCSVEDCDAPARARSFCSKHYERNRKWGDPLYVQPNPQNLPRFFGCVIDGCEAKHSGKGYCRRHYTAYWASENPERAKATATAYRDANREKARAATAAWREVNRERGLESARRWAAANPDRIRENKRQYRAANRDKIRALNNARKALQRGVEVNDLTAKQWTEIKALFKQRCAYCHCKPRVLTMDHVVPLSKGGHHTAANIVPACGSCNSKKNVGDAPTHQPLLM